MLDLIHDKLNEKNTPLFFATNRLVKSKSAKRLNIFAEIFSNSRTYCVKIRSFGKTDTKHLIGLKIPKYLNFML